MTWRWLGWGLVVAITIAVSWLWPRIDRAPTDFEIAVDYLNQQQPSLALLFFREPAWRGVAAYRAGRYAQASREFAAEETVASLYNLGNSYAQLRDWPNAITTYQRVLRFDPAHADALYNLALVQKAAEPPGHALEPEDQPEPPQSENEAPQLSIPQEADPQQTQAGASKQSDTAGNTSDTDEVGKTDAAPRPKPIETAGEVGSAAAVGQSSEDGGRNDRTVVGTVDLKPRKSTRSPEVLLRRIHDDPEKVLRARLLSAYEAKIGGHTE